MKKVFRLIIISLFAGTIYGYGQQPGSAGPDFEVDLVDGSKFKLSEQRGKVVLVFLFGNTCTSCLGAGPLVESNLYQRFAGNPNFTAIGLDTWDSSSNKNSVSGFKSKTGITFPLAIKAASVASAYGTKYDRLMVIDQNGVLVHKGIILVKNDIDNAAMAINNSLILAGVEDKYEEPQLNLFPNPVSDVLHIRTEEDVSGIELFDLSGKRVREMTFSSSGGLSDITLSVDNLKEGIYLYSIRTAGSERKGKLLIQR